MDLYEILSRALLLQKIHDLIVLVDKRQIEQFFFIKNVLKYIFFWTFVECNRKCTYIFRKALPDQREAYVSSGPEMPTMFFG